MSRHPALRVAPRHGTRAAPYPDADRPWAVETHGIGAVPDDDRHGRAVDLFWLWLAANLGIVGVVYGAVLAALHLDLAQAVAVAVFGTAGSFLLVGVLGTAGPRYGLPMLAWSRRLFGTWGNLGPALASWMSLVGWETITAIVAADALLALAPTIAAGPGGRWVVLGALGVVAGLSLLAGRLGHATIVIVQRFVAGVFGVATLAIAADLATRASWARAGALHPAPFASVLAGASVVAAAAGVSWVNVSADYTRYLPTTVRGRTIAWWTTLGASLPLVVLVVLGYVLWASPASMSSANDPIGAIRSALPGWAAVPYLVVAVTGLLAQMVMGLYSSGLNLLVIGVRAPRSRTVFLDAAIVVCLGGWLMTARQGLLGTFEGFVELLACPIASWAAVLLVGVASAQRTATRSGHGAWATTLSWLTGTVLGLLLTSSPLFTGPLARGTFAHSSLGYVAGAVIGAASLAVTSLFTTHKERFVEHSRHSTRR